MTIFRELVLLAGGSATSSDAGASLRPRRLHLRVAAVRRSAHAGRADRRRLLQGVGAAAQASVILAIIVTEFPEAGSGSAMSAYVFVSVAGGSPAF